MPRYFFNLANHERSIDDDGTELCDDNQARIEGVMFAGAYLRDNPDVIAERREFHVDVTDHNGKQLLCVVIKATDD